MNVKQKSQTMNRGTEKIKQYAAEPQPKTVSRPQGRPDVLLRLLIFLALFAFMFYGINAGWMNLRNIDVQGGIRLSRSDVIANAALDDIKGLWTIAVQRDSIKTALETNPYIDTAQVSIAGPFTLRIEITEREPVAATDYKGWKFVFDRTGELIDILSPKEICIYPVVNGAPPGLLRYRGIPLYRQAKIWELPDTNINPAVMELQFNRLIYLRNLVEAYATEHKEKLEGIWMESDGGIRVNYRNYPPILLGCFHNPDLQFRRMLAVLGNPNIADPEKTIDIDLSSELFPCYHVREKYFTRVERNAIAEWEARLAAESAATDEAGETELTEVASAESTDSSEWQEPEPDSEERDQRNGIFDLASGNSTNG